MKMDEFDLSCFDVILPEPNRLNVLAIRANKSGRVSLNAKMRSELQWDKILFAANAKADRIYIKQYTNEERYYIVPAKSTIEASTFTRTIVKRGVRLPARYIMSWNNKCQIWVGILDRDFLKPPTLKKSGKDNLPPLKTLV